MGATGPGGARGRSMTFDFTDWSVDRVFVESRGFAAAPAAGVDALVDIEFGFRDVEYSAFGISGSFDDVKVVDTDLQRIELFGVDLENPSFEEELSDGLTLSGKLPKGPDTKGETLGAGPDGRPRAEGVDTFLGADLEASEFLTLTADLDKILTSKMIEAKNPKIVAAGLVLENTIFANFQLDLSDYVPIIPSNVFTLDALVIDTRAKLGLRLGSGTSLDFGNGRTTPQIDIALISDNGTPDDPGDDHARTVSLGDVAELPIPTFGGFGLVQVSAEYSVRQASFGHSMGLNLTGAFTFEALKAAVAGRLGSLLDLSFGPLVRADIPSSAAAQQNLLDLGDLFIDGFAVPGSAFNTQTEVYDVFYTAIVPPGGIDVDAPGALQNLIVFLDEFTENREAAFSAAAEIEGARPELFGDADPSAANTFNFNGSDVRFRKVRLDFSLGGRDINSVNLPHDLPVATRNVVTAAFDEDAKSVTSLFFPQFQGTSSGQVLPPSDESALNLFIQTLPSPDVRGPNTLSYEQVQDRPSVQTGEVRLKNSANVIGTNQDDVVVYFGNEAQFFDAKGEG